MYLFASVGVLGHTLFDYNVKSDKTTPLLSVISFNVIPQTFFMLS